MAYTVVQGGTSLQFLTTAGALSTLTLPTNITLSGTRTPRFAIFGQYVVLVNSPSRPITIDGTGTVRVLTPAPPAIPPTLSGTAGGTLSGTYLARQTFRILDSTGNVISESGLGPVPATATTVTAQYLKAAGLDISVDAITDSQLYRTTTTGAVYFPWVVVSGNTQTSIQDDLSDVGLSLTAAPVLGSAPDLTLVAEWRGRLWGVSRTEIDFLRYTESGRMYAWPALNSLLVPNIGADSRGVTALAARREALGVGRRNLLQQVTGNTPNDFRMIKLSENVGIESQETVKVYRDTAYFLWKDGVYSWASEGIHCLSDKSVRSWFTTDSYFNRGKFSSAFAMIDPLRNRYILFLASASSSTTDSWVEYDLNEKTWWGPHKTAAFTPTCTLVAPDANDTLVPLIGSSSGFLWQNQATRTDDTSFAIDFSVNTKFHDGDSPDIMKYFGELSIIDKAQTGGTLVITPSVGGLDATAGTAINHDMTLGRQRLRRLGVGRMVQLNLRQNDVGQDVECYGYEIPFTEVGRR